MKQKQQEHKQIESAPIVIPETHGVMSRLDDAIQKSGGSYEDVWVCDLCGKDGKNTCRPKMIKRLTE